MVACYPNGKFINSKQWYIDGDVKILVYSREKIDTILLGDYKANAIFNGRFIRDSIFYDLFLQEVKRKDSVFFEYLNYKKENIIE